MNKTIAIVLLGIALSSCSAFRPHKMDIEQGNVVLPHKVKQLRLGMSVAQVKHIMGNPVLVNLFAQDRMDYIYTFQPAYAQMDKKWLTCLFHHGHLTHIQQGPPAA